MITDQGGDLSRFVWEPSQVVVRRKLVDPVAAAVSILKAAGLVRKDWSEDAHPRDEHGKFIEGGEAVSDTKSLQQGQTVTIMGEDGHKYTGPVISGSTSGNHVAIKGGDGETHYGSVKEGIVLHGAHAETSTPTTGAGVKVGDKITIDPKDEVGHIFQGQKGVVIGPFGTGMQVETESGKTAYIADKTPIDLHEPAGVVAPPVEGPSPGGTGTVTPPAEGEPFKGGQLEGNGPGKGVGELPKGQSGVKASSATSRQAVKDHYAGAPVERVAHLDDKRTAVELKDGRVIIYRNEGEKGVYASLGSKADMPKPQGVGKLPESQSKINASSAAGRQALKDYYANPGAHTLEHTSDTTSRITLSDGRVLDLRSENGKIYAKLDKSTLPGIGKPGAAETSTTINPLTYTGQTNYAGSLPVGTPVTTASGPGVIASHGADYKTTIYTNDGKTVKVSSESQISHGSSLGTGPIQTDFPTIGTSGTPAPAVSPTAASLQETLNQTAAQMGVGTLPEKGTAPLKVLPVGTQVKDPTGAHGYGVITSNPGLNDLNATKVGVKWDDGVNGAISNSGNVEYMKAPAGYKFLGAADGGTLIPDIPSSVSGSKPGAGPITTSAKLSGPEAPKAQSALASPIVANQPLGYASSVVTHENGQSFVYTKTGDGQYKVSAFNPAMVPKPSSYGGGGTASYSGHDAAGHAAELYSGFKSPTSNSEGVQWANQHFGSTPKVTGDELSKIKNYTGSGASTINSSLRNGNTPSAAKSIDSALAKNRAPADVVLHLGEPFSKYFTQAQLQNPEALKGHVVRDPGYKSTSVGQHAAFSSTSVQLHMAVPKGTPAAYIQNISHYPHEREVLLGRNLPMRVDDVVHAGNQYHVYLSVLPHDVAMGAAAS